MQQTRTTLQWMNDNWKLLAVLVGIIIAWTQLGSAVAGNTQTIEGLSAKHGALDITLLQIQKDLVEIRTSLKFIEQNVK
jgi:hypothetical protein